VYLDSRMETTIFIQSQSCILRSSDERLWADLEADSDFQLSTIIPIKKGNKMPFRIC
jgi:hypothetical protein